MWVIIFGWIPISYYYPLFILSRIEMSTHMLSVAGRLTLYRNFVAMPKNEAQDFGGVVVEGAKKRQQAWHLVSMNGFYHIAFCHPFVHGLPTDVIAVYRENQL